MICATRWPPPCKTIVLRCVVVFSNAFSDWDYYLGFLQPIRLLLHKRVQDALIECISIQGLWMFCLSSTKKSGDTNLFFRSSASSPSNRNSICLFCFHSDRFSFNGAKLRAKSISNVGKSSTCWRKVQLGYVFQILKTFSWVLRMQSFLSSPRLNKVFEIVLFPYRTLISSDFTPFLPVSLDLVPFWCALHAVRDFTKRWRYFLSRLTQIDTWQVTISRQCRVEKPQTDFLVWLGILKNIYGTSWYAKPALCWIK